MKYSNTIHKWFIWSGIAGGIILVFIIPYIFLTFTVEELKIFIDNTPNHVFTRVFVIIILGFIVAIVIKLFEIVKRKEGKE